MKKKNKTGGYLIGNAFKQLFLRAGNGDFPSKLAIKIIFNKDI